MTEHVNDPQSEDIERRIENIGQYSRLVRAGLGVILSAFGLALIGRLPYNLQSIPQAVNAILLPLIFVGIGLILFGIGMHLHLMHLNLVRQIRKQAQPPSDQNEPE